MKLSSSSSTCEATALALPEAVFSCLTFSDKLPGCAPVTCFALLPPVLPICCRVAMTLTGMVNSCASAPAIAPRRSSTAVLTAAFPPTGTRRTREMYSVRTTVYQ